MTNVFFRTAVLALAVLPVAVFAQSPTSAAVPDISALSTRQTARLRSSLGLNDSQAKEVYHIHVKAYTAVANLLASQKGVAKPDPKALAANTKSIVTQKDTALQQVLTGAQMTAYKQKAPQRLIEFETMMMKTQLQLDGTQTGQVANINATAIQAMIPILKEMPNLRPLQQKRASDKLKAITQQRDTRLKGVLTGAQMQKYQASAQARSEFIKAYLQP